MKSCEEKHIYGLAARQPKALHDEFDGNVLLIHYKRCNMQQPRFLLFVKGFWFTLKTTEISVFRPEFTQNAPQACDLSHFTRSLRKSSTQCAFIIFKWCIESVLVAFYWPWMQHLRFDSASMSYPDWQAGDIASLRSIFYILFLKEWRGCTHILGSGALHHHHRHHHQNTQWGNIFWENAVQVVTDQMGAPWRRKGLYSDIFQL